MSPIYVRQNVSTCTEDPYAEARVSLQRAASKEYSRLRFYDTQNGQRSDSNTGSLYGDLKELQQKVSA